MPQEPFWSSDQDAARRSLVAIDAWRASFVAWLGQTARDDVVSEHLASTLLELLGARSTEDYRRYPYRLGPFPAGALEATSQQDPCAALRAILSWRAGVIDFVSDVWDTLGPADLGMEECRRVATLLTPTEPDAAARRCPLCLGEQGAGHFDGCAVQLEWRGVRVSPAEP